MDYEDVVNMTNLRNSTEVITPKQSMRDITHEIIFLICCIFAFISDVIIILTILCFKQMRNARNYLIANWAVMDLCSLLVTPSAYRIFSIFYNFSISSASACILFQLGAALHFMVIVCVLVLLVDWCIAAYFPNVSKKIRKYYNILLGLIWLLLIVVCVIYCNTCKYLYFNFIHVLATLGTSGTTLIFILVLRFIIMVQNCKKKPLEYSKLALNLGSVFILCYIMALVNIALVEILRIYNPMVAMLSACLVFCNSIVTLLILYFYDINFQAHIIHILKCRSYKYKNQANELENQFREVTFDTTTEQLVTNVY